jgi:hypothetical protein
MAKPYLLVNETQNTLATEYVRGTDNHVHLTSATGFPTGGGYIRIGDSTSFCLCEYTAVSTNDLTTVTACTLGKVVSVGDETKTWPIGTVVARVWVAEEAAELITGPASATGGHFFKADGTTGKLAKAEAIAITELPAIAASTILANITAGAAAPTAVTSDAYQGLRLWQLGKVIIHDVFTSDYIWTPAYSGTGAIVENWGEARVDLVTGTNNAGYARFYSKPISYFAAVGSGVQRWMFQVTWGGTAITTNTAMMGIWDANTWAVPCVLTTKHYGFKILNGVLWATNADGATEKATTTGITITASSYEFYGLEVIFIPSTSCRFYVNGVLKVTHTDNVPAAINCQAYFDIVNSGTATRRILLGALTGEYGE